MSLGKRLKEVREKRGYTQIAVAKKLGITNTALSNYERGERDPDTTLLKRLAELYLVSIDWLLGSNQNPGAGPDQKTTTKTIDILDALEDYETITAGDQPITKEQRVSILRALINPRHGQGRTTPKIPILGTIRAGIPLLSEHNIVDDLDIPVDLEGQVDYALIVRGDSMVGAGISEGDIVICKKSKIASHGQIVTALIDGETTLKFHLIENGRPLLRAANPEYQDIELKPGSMILGHVVRVQKQPPSINTYKEFLYYKEGILQEWNKVLEKAINYGIKPDLLDSVIDTQLELARKFTGKP